MTVSKLHKTPAMLVDLQGWKQGCGASSNGLRQRAAQSETASREHETRARQNSMCEKKVLLEGGELQCRVVKSESSVPITLIYFI